jgi:hypothetical protein
MIWLPFQNPNLTDTTKAMAAALLYPITILIQYSQYRLVLWHTQSISSTGNLDVKFRLLIFWHFRALFPKN